MLESPKSYINWFQKFKDVNYEEKGHFNNYYYMIDNSILILIFHSVC